MSTQVLFIKKIFLNMYQIQYDVRYHGSFIQIEAMVKYTFTYIVKYFFYSL